MKITQIILKNTKVLFRSKGTLVMTVLGPLFIILLVGLAFSSSQNFKISIGTYTPEHSALAQSFSDHLSKDQFTVISFPSPEECKTAIRKGGIHTCIIFPKNFKIENGKTNEIVIYVDNSRQNLVYQVISSLSKNIELRSSELSLGMTSTLLSTLFTTKDTLKTDLLKIINMKQQGEDIQKSGDETLSDINTIDLSQITYDLSPIVSKSQDLSSRTKEIKEKGMDIAKEAKSFADLVQQNTSFNTDPFMTSIATLQTELNTLYNTTPEKLRAVLLAIDDTESELEGINTKLSGAQELVFASTEKINLIRRGIQNIRNDLDILSSSLQTTIDRIDAVDVTSAQAIVSPITTTVKPVTTENSTLLFLFPSLLILVVLFIGLFLSSTIIIMEKNSRAAFRNFTTPTSRIRIVFAHFLTVLLLVLAQALIIIALAFIFLHSNLFHNFGTTLLLLIISGTLFVLLGILIGNLFSTQEGAMIVSLSLGTILLLLSNFIIPLENVSGILKTIVSYNPFVITTDALTKSLLFNIPFTELLKPICLLILFASIAYLLIIITKNFTRNKTSISQAFITYTSPAPVLVLAQGKTIENIPELIIALKEMSDDTFHEYCSGKKNDFSIWLSHTHPFLSRRTENKTREQMITILENHGAPPKFLRMKRKE